MQEQLKNRGRYMSDFFPEEPKKLKERISRYKRQLKKGDRDGAGKRYLVGPMYQLLGNLEGALEFYSWFQKEYDDDCGEPYMSLCWTLALLQDGQTQAAIKKLRATMFSNLYLVPHLLGEPIKTLDIWLGSNWEWLDYAQEIPRELIRLWTEEDLEWVKKTYYGAVLENDRKQYIAINRKLNGLPPGQERSALVMASHSLQYGEKPDRKIPRLHLVTSDD